MRGKESGSFTFSRHVGMNETLPWDLFPPWQSTGLCRKWTMLCLGLWALRQDLHLSAWPTQIVLLRTRSVVNRVGFCVGFACTKTTILYND
jgi:hypothetical protein